jgi:hypothetical protein
MNLPALKAKLDPQFDAILRHTGKDQAIICAIDRMYCLGNSSSSSVKAKFDPYHTQGRKKSRKNIKNPHSRS